MVRSDQAGAGFTLVDRLFYEPLDRYVPNDVYLAPIREMLGPEWSHLQAGFWTQCLVPGTDFLKQGWKIHLSSTPENARELLRRVVPLLDERRVPFKFVSDPAMHAMSLSKTWPREAAGKFMTIYPSSDEAFKELVVELDARTRDLRGPYILSDRPYADSRTVFYRYGEHIGGNEVNAQGFFRHVIHSPTGDEMDDTRTPYYQRPAWVDDPYGHRAVENVRETGRQVKLADRYRVIEALKFNSNGGIYLAEDERTGGLVVVREARPLVGMWAPGMDAISMLQKEARILEKLSPLGLCPGFVDLFQQWEHWFLVQDRIDGHTMWQHAIAFYWGVRSRPTPRESFRLLRRAILAVMDGMQAFHDKGVVLRDMTRTNVLMSPAGRPIFIDFEMAYEMDRDDPPVPGFTPGFASNDQLLTRTPTPADDHFALGALILDMVTFMAPGLPLHRQGIMNALRRTLADLELPREIAEVVDGLMDQDASRRWTPDRVRAALTSVPLRDVPAARASASPAQVADPFSIVARPAPTAELRRQVEGTIPGVIDFIRSSASPERTDRLFPASPEVFLTNAVNLHFGAAGVMSFVRAAGAPVEEAWVDWIVARLRARPVPPGLYVGRAGVAMAMADFGRPELALELVDGLKDDPLTELASGLFYGAAGVGVALLSLARRLDRPELTAQAVEIGERLLRTGKRSGKGSYWHPERHRVPLGLGHGQAGIALFLAYLHAVTGDARYLETARRALAFDLRHVLRTSGEVLWTPTTDAGAGEPKSPHVEFGAAGIGMVALRMYQVTRDPQHLAWAWECARGVCERFTNKLWYGYGLSGFGQFLLDMHRFVGDENCLNTAWYHAEAILSHRIPTRSGIGFPGLELARMSCDFGMGSAGIGWFMLRLLDPSRPHPFLPDELLPAHARAELTEAPPAQWPVRVRRRKRRVLAATG
ncbi:MAG TPA: class III lanthionine synthetase LanKC [Longimicrobium sp.]|nr:class III lanthionine synthetase LanKC [Longimicrobium sp.]